MNRERWNTVVNMIKEKFSLEEEYQQALSEGVGTVEGVVFTSPIGRMKLECMIRPVVTGRKVLSTKRIGSAAQVQYTYSEDEFTYKMGAYRYNEATGQWEEMRPESLLTA